MISKDVLKFPPILKNIDIICFYLFFHKLINLRVKMNEIAVILTLTDYLTERKYINTLIDDVIWG